MSAVGASSASVCQRGGRPAGGRGGAGAYGHGGRREAFTGPSFWAPFQERCHTAGIARLSDWLKSTGRIVKDQFTRRGPRSSRPADTPLTTSPLDGFINPIRASIQPRAYGLKNRERTNRLLMLMQLHANRQDDEHAYVRQIRACLETNQGRPNIGRRAIVVGTR